MSRQTQINTTDLDHARNQSDMYIGNKEVLQLDEYVPDADWKTISLETLKFSPALVKLFDEMIVNAVDQITIGNIGDIYVELEISDAGALMFSVTNYGANFDICKTKDAEGNEQWSAYMAFGRLRTSGNFKADKTKDTESLTGGMFGLGIKLVNLESDEFGIEVFDAKNQILYTQTWRNGMRTFDPPVLKSEEGKEGFVMVQAKPKMADFGNPGAEVLRAGFRRVLEMRVAQTAAFCYKRCRVFYNGNEIKLRNYDLCAMIARSNELVNFRIGPAGNLGWELVLGAKSNQTDLQTMTVMNGIHIKNGSHIKWIVDQIVEFVKPLWIELKDPASAKKKAARATKKATKSKDTAKPEAKEHKVRFDRRYVLKYLFVGIFGYIPGMNPTGQRKDEIQTSVDKFAGLIIPRERLSELWAFLKPKVEFDIFTKAADQDRKANGPTKRIVKAKKYERAEWAGGKRSSETCLIVSEGDSANGLVKKIIGFMKGHNKYGTYTIGGVSMSVRKKIKYSYNNETEEIEIERSDKLVGYERYQELVGILTLQYGKKYETLKDLEDLSYRRVIIATDQDEDGKGNIRSHLFNFFWTFWPGLVRLGFVQFWITPVIRAFHPTQPLLEFFNERTYHEWSNATSQARWSTVYYKGLGSHGDEEAEHMAKTFESCIITFTADENTETACEVYFGKNANLRKKVLVSPPKYNEEDYYTKERTISGTFHLNTETRSYQIYNTKRHLVNFIDRQLPSYRKIIAGARQSAGRRIKVYMFAGDVAKKKNYHHGDSSLNGGIISCAQVYPGALAFPPLLPLSQFGSRKYGGDDAGSPRYIFTKYNRQLMNAMFPPVDDYILDYTFDDGHMGEPVFYVPIVPLAILENYKSPGHGWACTVWARDYWDVSEHLHKCLDMCSPTALARAEDFPISRTTGIKQVISKDGNVAYGTFERLGPNLLQITELPIRVWNSAVLETLNDLDEVVSYSDRSNDYKIDIEVKFIDGFLAGKTDQQLLDLLGLKQSLKSNLNMINRDGGVTEFTKYFEIFEAWYPIRLAYYRKRIERMTLLRELQIMMVKNQLEFISKRESLKISGLPKVKQCEILKLGKFPQLDKTILDRPMYTQNSELRSKVLEGPGANYNYLRKMDGDDLSEEGQLGYAAELKTLEEEYKALKMENADFKLWKSELSNLDKIVKFGQTNSRGWLGWEPKKIWPGAKVGKDNDPPPPIVDPEPDAEGSDVEL